MVQNHLHISLRYSRKSFAYPKLLSSQTLTDSALRSSDPRLAPWRIFRIPQTFYSTNRNTQKHQRQRHTSTFTQQQTPALTPIAASLIHSSYDTFANMDSGKVPVKLVKVTRVLGRTGNTPLSSPYPSPSLLPPFLLPLPPYAIARDVFYVFSILTCGY